MRLASERRAEITVARARARAAGERPAIVSTLEDPMVSASVDHLPFMLHGADVSLTLEQKFPLSRVLGNRRRGAEAQALRLRGETDRVRLDVELDAAKAFLMLQERRQMAGILKEQLALAHQLVSATNARYSSGGGAQSDVLRAEIEVSRLAAAIRSLGSEIAGAHAMLNASLARPVEAKIPALANVPPTAVAPGWADVRKVALGVRPELASGRAENLAAQADIAAMKSMYSPMAVVQTGPAYTMSDGAGWMLMLGISVPIWRDGLNSGVREAEAMAAMARADLRAMTQMIEGEAATARYRVLAARERYLSLKDEILPRARRMIDATLTTYSAGTLQLVSVLEAAQTLWSVEGELVTAEFELGSAWAQFQRATGSKKWKQR